MNKTSNIAFLSVISNSFVVLLKLIVGLLTGSVAVISEAIHSSLDLLASLIAFISVRISGKPADKDHPFGHGKVENISGTIETLLIFVAGIWIIYECVHKLLHPEAIKFPALAVAVMLVGAIINFIVSRIVKKEADRANSIAMKSNAFHLLTDVYTSLGVAAGLLLVLVSGWHFLDPLIGIALAIYIMIEAVKLLKEAFPPLLDAKLDQQEEEKILNIIHEYENDFLEIHDFKTRRAGPNEYIEFHMVVPSEETVQQIHQLCDEIEQDIQAKFNKSHILIHVEPETELKG
ncbi:cation diffusion facilitator family transporter [Oceanobacillus kimchii]|uniref:cation diffusion facilitator family transporter n=1 Tax=Oceanobacillus kimchii TaxID=746691 RepID=UPI0021A94C82|nr:cation diffusion facilitator family transporter [Oceanobacillus kimchii]MCT1577971.1 cation diffusion facilitator family transporter [Oceanobacillus kimchii]MCT2137531.1 cation diffusion facilitator family transporter [Oceanobacillus kimchii]